MVFFTINSCFMSFTLKGWWLPHHGHHFLPRKTVLWVSHGMAMQDSDTKSFQFAMHLHSVIVWSSLNIARFITHIFQKLENMHSLPKKHCQKLETTTTPTQKSHQNIFLLILKVFVGVMTLETWPSTHLPFSQRFVFPQNFQLTQGRQLSAVFPKKNGTKISRDLHGFASTVLELLFVWKNCRGDMGEVDFVPKQKKKTAKTVQQNYADIFVWLKKNKFSRSEKKYHTIIYPSIDPN